eukprot:TRINITY_DN21494_c0_g1_i1.p1 TRINITY_DN21494_c0_g1~~TRINITY_DN21494_c0_g1_i1.p1  ORF type:complete len:809 (-),score=148.05 TRINITY_DN21494_c0_g1_i1:160-2586(-)
MAAGAGASAGAGAAGPASTWSNAKRPVPEALALVGEPRSPSSALRSAAAQRAAVGRTHGTGERAPALSVSFAPAVERIGNQQLQQEALPDQACFDDLLDRLAMEHEREVRELRRRLELACGGHGHAGCGASCRSVAGGPCSTSGAAVAANGTAVRRQPVDWDLPEVEPPLPTRRDQRGMVQLCALEASLLNGDYSPKRRCRTVSSSEYSKGDKSQWSLSDGLLATDTDSQFTLVTKEEPSAAYVPLSVWTNCKHNEGPVGGSSGLGGGGGGTGAGGLHSPGAARHSAASLAERGPEKSYDGFLRHFIAYPSSPRRLAWDLIGAFLIFYDLIMIPVTQVFDPPDYTFVAFMETTSLLFWTFNMAASLLVGYTKDGVIIMVPGMILTNYIKTWFAIDVAVVVPDWAFTIAASDSNSGGESVKLLRVLRLVRMARLLRLLKLRKTLNKFNEMIDSEYTSIICNIIQMILLLLVINHLVGCLWFAMGSWLQMESNWVTEFHFHDDHWFYQYLTSLHWSITQFTPASMHVQPMNEYERLFAIIIVVFALVGFSYVVGSITGSLAQLRAMQEDATKQFWNLRRYLKQNKVPLALSHRISKYLEHAWATQQTKLPVKSVPILGLLSEQLTCELQSELYVPHLSIHPFFSHLNMTSSVTMNRLANNAILRKALARDDVLFHLAENATNMYIVVDGRLIYDRIDDQGDTLNTEMVDKGEDWIAEPVLWLQQWPHLGSLQAMTESDLLLVIPQRFSEILTLNPRVHKLACRYCANYLEWLQNVEQSGLSDISQGEDVGPMLERFCSQADWETRESRGY